MWKWIDSFIHLFFPQSCIVCDGPLSSSEKYICIKCLSSIPRTNFHLHRHNNAEKYFWGQIPIERATSFLYYSKGSDFKEIFYYLKYRNNKEIGEFMGRITALEIQNSGFFSDIDIIIPIPLHKRKKKERGYNQSEWIAKGISKITGIPINTTLLCRKIHNPTQTRKNAYERWENVQEIFSVSGNENINGKHILLVDDVLTTGATLLSASQTLTKVYNIKISIFTLAIA